ncbi:voltage-dependent T-type calcium channel subunit alpha-1H-like [Megalobrama amblycephala]|uniref:voltage-dependent T-type calcium channel subunit alpha-1H-like n=1 Tax=Megalobrama amblycephala TaxID=75352 RepID=UPI0020144B68|nr:voltage-dependent T-type calcium channel subunit alpha-1H-like [Megalobrama amblycephala]
MDGRQLEWHNEGHDQAEDKNCVPYLPLVSPIYFVTFVLMAQFVLVNVVVAILMQHLQKSNEEAKEDAEMDAEIIMEMIMTRHLSNISVGSCSESEGRATYVGPRPNSPR